VLFVIVLAVTVVLEPYRPLAVFVLVYTIYEYGKCGA
jgi:hypothetical protein